MSLKLPFSPPPPPQRGRPPADAADSAAGNSRPSAKGSTAPPSHAMSVTALVTQIKNALAAAFPRRVAVVGEISNLKLHSSGHIYFRLKDAGSAIDAAMFRSAAARLKFRPTDGLEVVVEGQVDVYDVRGQLQFYVESMTPKGAGSLELAFRQLCQRLQAEGLFDPGAKVPLVRVPRAIGLVTSPTGAAIRDIRRTLGRRWPAAAVYLVPALVQGEGAAESVAAAISLLDASAERYAIDTIIVARGGGSMEDLWAFNEEVVARAIFACRTPVICGVGHEVDVTIADMVADVRAATPTAAAELAVPDKTDVARRISVLAGRLNQRMTEQIRHARGNLDACLRSVVFRDPQWRLRAQTQRIDELEHRLRASLRQLLTRDRRKLEPLTNRLAALHPARLRERATARLDRAVSRLTWVLGGRSKRAGDALAILGARLLAANPRNRAELVRQRLAGLERQLEAMSYRSVLQRGFSVTRIAGGQIIRSSADAAQGMAIETELADGKIRSVVDSPGTAAKPAPPRKNHKNDDEQPQLF